MRSIDNGIFLNYTETQSGKNTGAIAYASVLRKRMRACILFIVLWFARKMYYGQKKFI